MITNMNRTKKELEQLTNHFANEMATLYQQTLEDIVQAVVNPVQTVRVFLLDGRFTANVNGKLYKAVRRRDLLRTLRQKGFEPVCPFEHCPTNR